MTTTGFSTLSDGRSRKAVAYVRPTNGTQAALQQSLDQMERDFAVFCDKVGYQPSGTFADTGATRPGAYDRLLECIRGNSKGLTVVIPALDVFGAKTDEIAAALLEIDDLGARIQLMANGHFVDPMRVLTGNWPQPLGDRNIRERIKSAMKRRALRGEGLGKPPYGYRIGKNRKLEVVPEEAETVKLIYSLYTQKNMGIRLIVRHLNEQHIATRKGRNWSMVTIRDILRNRAYLGTYTRFGMKVPGSHPAIITPDMFRWAQTRLDERKPTRKNGHAEPFVLSGLIYCGYCNNRMVGVTRKQAWTRRKDGTRAEKQYRYYQCQSRTNQSICQYHTRRASDLESAVLDHLKAERPRVAALKGRKALSAQALAKVRTKVEAARRSTERRLRHTLQAIAAPGSNRDALRKQALALIRARRQHDDKLAALQRQSSETTETLGAQAAAAIDKLVTGWATLDCDHKREALETLLEAVTVFDDRVNIKLRVG